MYNGFIVKIKEVRKHSNADKLQVATVFDSSVIVGLDAKEGDIVLYFPVDGQLGIEYATKNNLIRIKNEDGTYSGGYLDSNKRNIVALKLRGEKSDGLIMPLESLKDFTDISKLKVGDQITILNGITICEKYIPRSNQRSRNSVNSNSKQKKIVKDKFPLFMEHKETNQLAYCMGDFKIGDLCYITLKMHGTSQRTAYTIKESLKKQNWFQRLFKIKNETIKSWEYVTGTRRTTLEDFNKPTGYYGSDSFRKQYHDYFVDKLHKGEEIFYEVLGYTDSGKLIMGECNNEKTKDKEFIKQYGKTTKFTYGCEPNNSVMYVYRMTMTNEDGVTIEYSTELIKQRCEQMGCNFVPQFDRFLFTTEEDLMDRVNSFIDGADPIGKNHIREGVVVRIDSSTTFKAYKSKSFNFKILEGIIKTDAVEADMEESQDLIGEK